MAQRQEMTPSQVVAWHLWQERKRRGWSQEQMSRRLAQHGVVWEKATYYAAEASRDPDNEKPRRFSADEILAFALAFDRPVASFLVLPECASMVVGEHVVSPVRLMEAGIAKDMGDMRDLAERLRALATAIEVFEEARQPEPRAATITRALEGFDQPVADATQTRVKAIERLHAFEDRLRDVLRRASGEPLSEAEIKEEVERFRQSVGEIPTAKELGEVESPRRGEETRR